MSCAIIPYDQIGCLDIKIVSGFEKFIDFEVAVVENGTTTPINLSQFDDVILNVYNKLGNVRISELSKKLGEGVELDSQTKAVIKFGSETLNVSGDYYYNVELYKLGVPSKFYLQGFLIFRKKFSFVKKPIVST